MRLVVTRSEVRVFLKRTTPGHPLEGATNFILAVGGKEYGGGMPLFGDWWVHSAPASRLYDFVIDARLYDKHGVWKIVIPQDRNGWGWRKLIGGPWTFRLRY